MLSNVLLFCSLASSVLAVPYFPAWPTHPGPPSWHGPHGGRPRPTGGPIQGNPVVAIPSGVLIGTTTTVAGPPNATATVNKFLGIPFAAPPVGDLRFAPPQDPARWERPLNVSVFSPSCIQQFPYPELTREFSMYFQNGNTPPYKESEDCLYLNVFTPTNASAEAGGRAVMFWIYGGTLETGYAGLNVYDGSSIAANQDVIVVTINYRENAFGYSNSPQIAFGQQNSGFLDQRKALEWVQQNIHAFGGDPTKVTVFGESAGGYSVKQLLANPPSPLTFRAAIMESEATVTTGGVSSWQALVAALNCTTSTSAIACVRAANATLIKNIIEVNDILFPPVPDNITDSINVAPNIATKKWADVPFMIGTNANEGRVFEIGQTNLTAFLASTFAASTLLQQAIAAMYPANIDGTREGYYAISDVATKAAFLCAHHKIADLATANNYTAYRYYFNASFPNTMPYPNLGAYHGAEIPLVFGTYDKVNATAQQIALSAYMQGAWADFAKNPSAGPGWPKVGSAAADIADLGGNGSSGEYQIPTSAIDGSCALYDLVLAVTGI